MERAIANRGTRSLRQNERGGAAKRTAAGSVAVHESRCEVPDDKGEAPPGNRQEDRIYEIEAKRFIRARECAW